MGKNMGIEEIKKKIIPILRRHGVKKAGIFGSVVRGEATQKSDIDILVEIERDISLLDFVRLQLEIEEVLGRKVDLGEYDTIKPLIKDRILKEQVNIL
jgi:predicted nucleotidyltransferase